MNKKLRILVSLVSNILLTLCFAISYLVSIPFIYIGARCISESVELQNGILGIIAFVLFSVGALIASITTIKLISVLSKDK